MSEPRGDGGAGAGLDWDSAGNRWTAGAWSSRQREEIRVFAKGSIVELIGGWMPVHRRYPDRESPQHAGY